MGDSISICSAISRKAAASFLVLFCISAIGCSGGGGGGTGVVQGVMFPDSYTEAFSMELDALGIVDLDVSTVNGSMEITGYAGDAIRVDGTKRADAEGDLEKVDLQVETEAGHMLMRVAHSDDTSKAIDLQLLVPEGLLIAEATSVNGRIDISGVPVAYAATTNSRIVVEIDSLEHGGIGLSSNTGTVVIYISQGLDVAFDVATNQGSIDFHDLNVTLVTDTAHRAEGLMGVGGPVVDISTNLGNIDLYQL